jgi:hypothetical protein
MNAITTPHGGTSALQLIKAGCPLAVQYLCTNRQAYSARTAMLMVLAHTSAVSPMPNNRDPPIAVATKEREAAAIIRLWDRRSAGVHTDAKNASSMPLYAIAGR